MPTVQPTGISCLFPSAERYPAFRETKHLVADDEGIE